jgi:phosphate starvation-inducible PhoH-like protein
MKKGKNNFSEFYIPKSDNQNKYLEYLNHNKCKIVISIGPAGTGKTMFACQSAVTLLKKEEINKIIITRPVVTVEEEIGFLPGNIIKKMDPWTKPIFDIFMEHFSKSDLDIMLNSNKIEICPLAFMRGRTFKNAFIIADEMQNSSPSQMKMLTTRLGDNSKMVITGDLKQSDIQTENGLNDLITRLKKYENINNSTELINIIEFDNSDIERSEIVKKVIDIYDLQEFKKSDNIDTNLQNSTIVLCKEETKEETKEKPKNINSDCALIPKHYVSHNFDIFFPPKDF